jgi:hypothetical protein
MTRSSGLTSRVGKTYPDARAGIWSKLHTSQNWQQAPKRMVDGVGRDLGCVDHDAVHKRAVEEVFEAEVEVGFRAGDGGAEVGLRYPLQPFTLLELCRG